MDMTVRITRISILREGPLRDDVTLEPRLLNLIYGRNESGKTYIVEALISLLFRTGRNTPWTSIRTRTRVPTVREWDPRGEIEVSGLEEGVIVFSPGSPKLEDYTFRDQALPEDLSRLMVVRAGDTRLSGAGDGVGDEVLRTYLSGNRVLDEVESGIEQETVKNARITDGIIVADNKGLIKDRLTLEHELSYIDELRKEVDEKASLVVMNSLQRRRQRIESLLGEMEDAKRHRAFQVYEEKQKLELELDRLPSEKDLMDLYRDMSVFDDRKIELEGLDGRMKDIPPVEEDLRWIEMAGEEYLPAAGTSGGTSGFVKACHWLLPGLIVLSAAGAFFSRILALAAAAGGLACLAVIYLGRTFRISPEAMERLRRLEEEFQRRFDRPLTDPAALKVVRGELEKQQMRYSGVMETRKKAREEILRLERDIRTKFRSLCGEDVPPEEWDGRLEGMRDERKELQDAIVSRGSVLASLNVQPDYYLSEPPEVSWDQKAYLDLRDELESVSQSLQEEKRNLDQLKDRIASATNGSSRDIRDLITALEDKRREVAGAHRAVTARILAENTVYRAVRHYRSRENARLEDALGSPEVINPLCEITGRYNGIRMTENGELDLNVSGSGTYPLSRLSTGAAEQVYVALRTGFAQLSLGKPAFLILDDAFQHSDWERRKKLVDHVTELARSGWQIFYFTMDDHLRKLFEARGRELGPNLYSYTSLN